jgi:hypothetical protein
MRSRDTTQLDPCGSTQCRQTSAARVTSGGRVGLLCGGFVPAVHPAGSRGNFVWFGLSAVFSRHGASLATSANLLSSFTAVDKARLLPAIIAGFNRMSRLAGRAKRSASGAHCVWLCSWFENQMNIITEIIVPATTTQSISTFRSKATNAPLASNKCGISQ